MRMSLKRTQQLSELVAADACVHVRCDNRRHRAARMIAAGTASLQREPRAHQEGRHAVGVEAETTT
jgi:hypothetical protein